MDYFIWNYKIGLIWTAREVTPELTKIKETRRAAAHESLGSENVFFKDGKLFRVAT